MAAAMFAARAVAARSASHARLASVALPSLAPLGARTLVTPTQPAERFGLFRGLFKKRSHVTNQPTDPTKLTVFNQWMLPEDLRLPTPGEPLLRFGAGAFDLAVSIGFGALVGYAAHSLGVAPHLALGGGQAAATLAWVVRDGLADDGTRSFGKKLFGLEITYWDGTVAERHHTLFRNLYFLIFPLASLHPMAEVAAQLLLVFDLSSVLLTEDSRKLGDFLFQTRVSMERPDREGRLEESRALAEMKALRAEINEMAPGLLEHSEHAGDQWHEDVQRSMVTVASAAQAEEADLALKKLASGGLPGKKKGKAPGGGAASAAAASAGAAAAAASAAAPGAPPKLPPIFTLEPPSVNSFKLTPKAPPATTATTTPAAAAGAPPAAAPGGGDGAARKP